MIHKLTFFLLIGLAIHSDAFADDGPRLVIQGGYRFDTKLGEFVPNKNIEVVDGRFKRLDAGDIKADVKKLVLTGGHYILPGLIDLHAHYNVRLLKKRREEFTVMPVVYLANGATVTFSAGEYDPEGMQQLRKDIESGKKLGPRLVNSGPYFGRARPTWGRRRDKADIIADVKKWAPLVGGFKAKSIRSDDLKVLIEEAHKHNLTVTGHLDSGYRSSVNPRDAIAMGIDRIEHFLGGDALPDTQSAYSSLKDVTPDMPEILKIIRLYVEKEIWFDATITAYGYYGNRGEGFDYWIDERQFFTPHVREVLKDKKHKPMEVFEKIFHVKQKTIKAFYDAGGKITLGTDHPSDGNYLPGFGVHRELDVLVKSGIKPVDAIRIGTINGAKALRIDKDHGSIDIGKVADLFIVEGNPLKNIRNTRNGRYVVRAGELHSTNELLESVKGKIGPKNVDEEKDW